MTFLLVFGSSGQLGQEIRGLAAAQAVSCPFVPESEADITDPAAVAAQIASHCPAVVVNAAAYTQADDAETHVEEAFRINETGVAVLARACAESRTPLIHVSTDYVFEGTKHGAYREDDPVAPINVYGRSKVAGEAILRQLAQSHIILRTSWLYGVYRVNFLKTIMRIAAERPELQVVNDQHGCPTGTADLAQAILIAAKRLAADATISGTYHFGGTGVTTWHGFACEIVAAQSVFTGRQPPVRAVSSASYARPARRPANSELDSSLFADTFGFRAMHWKERTHQVVNALLSGTEATTQ